MTDTDGAALTETLTQRMYHVAGDELADKVLELFEASAGVRELVRCGQDPGSGDHSPDDADGLLEATLVGTRSLEHALDASSREIGKSMPNSATLSSRPRLPPSSETRKRRWLPTAAGSMCW